LQLPDINVGQVGGVGVLVGAGGGAAAQPPTLYLEHPEVPGGVQHSTGPKLPFPYKQSQHCATPLQVLHHNGGLQAMPVHVCDLTKLGNSKAKINNPKNI